MCAADVRRAILIIHPSENCGLADRQPVHAVGRLLAGRLQRQRSAAIVQAQKAAHRQRQGGRREGAPLVATEAQSWT